MSWRTDASQIADVFERRARHFEDAAASRDHRGDRRRQRDFISKRGVIGEFGRPTIDAQVQALQQVSGEDDPVRIDQPGNVDDR